MSVVQCAEAPFGIGHGSELEHNFLLNKEEMTSLN